MEYYQNFIKNEKLRRWVVLAFLIAVLYFVRSILPLMLLTFVFSYLAYRFVSFIERKIKLPGKISGFILYSVILFLIYLGITEYIPVLINQLTHLINAVSKFYQNNSNGESALMDSIYNLFKEYNLADKLQSSLGTLVDYVTSFGKGLLIVVFAFLMSFFFTIDRKETNKFSALFLESDFAWFFEDVYYLASKFFTGFGVVLETQFIIALVNTALTLIALSFMGFPELLSLGVMIFLLSLVPVAGVLVSCIPLSIIGYSIGGIRDVIFVLLMVALIHALESYVLNPHLMAHKTKLPMFYTFVILFLGEHFFGVWGLIVGIPIFNFALDILGVKEIHFKKLKK
ncbi:AI-2E family transporter [Lactococcus petauri]|uniref:AI-2E family transporter n=1 Tax=Lactococcus petauri TaxID=1940789 RepID=UPI003854CC07